MGEGGRGVDGEGGSKARCGVPRCPPGLAVCGASLIMRDRVDMPPPCAHRYALDNIPKNQAASLYTRFVTFEKQHGDREGIEDVVVSKRRRVRLHVCVCVCGCVCMCVCARVLLRVSCKAPCTSVIDAGPGVPASAKLCCTSVAWSGVHGPYSNKLYTNTTDSTMRRRWPRTR